MVKTMSGECGVACGGGGRTSLGSAGARAGAFSGFVSRILAAVAWSWVTTTTRWMRGVGRSESW